MIITITGQKGGTKKTTTALNVGQMLNASAIVDLETNSSIDVINNLRENPLNVVKFNSNEKLAKFLVSVKASEVVIIDCGGYDSDMANIAMEAADTIIIPITEGVTDRNGLISTQRKFEMLDIEHKAIVFPNGEHHAKKHFSKLEEIVSLLPDMIFRKDLAIPQCAYVRDAAEAGLSIAEFNKHCKSYRAYKRLCDELVPF
ncbi:ParA family protein (plasmid) [Vibrio harveyi]|uniref:ParA family protein n=1 Tax=Vibrio harveyi TaxID=669 RepID=UPI00234D8A7D|nr:ParA family protein [Vibrio harveyi]WCP84206.1 ParA family protein [Vibrio harveyi]